jgi:ubiquinone/menaquinone biosynthesis C-methylase UbiE
MSILTEIKQRQQKTWSAGNYGLVAGIVSPLGDVLCEAIDLKPGSSVLDVACGTGNAALAAARRFCNVTGIDYVPALLEQARRRAEVEGLTISLREGDAEDIPFPGDCFDVVLSTLGSMFAPNQEKAAEELLRVCRGGGTIGMINWTPEGFLGGLFRTIAKHVPPTAGLKSPMLWGTEDRVRELFRESVSSLSFARGSIAFRFRSAVQYVEFFRTYYGPTLKAFEALAPMAQDALAQDILSLVEEHNRATDGTAVWPVEYLIVMAKKR